MQRHSGRSLRRRGPSLFMTRWSVERSDYVNQVTEETVNSLMKCFNQKVHRQQLHHTCGRWSNPMSLWLFQGHLTSRMNSECFQESADVNVNMWGSKIWFELLVCDIDLPETGLRHNFIFGPRQWQCNDWFCVVLGSKKFACLQAGLTCFQEICHPWLWKTKTRKDMRSKPNEAKNFQWKSVHFRPPIIVWWQFFLHSFPSTEFGSSHVREELRELKAGWRVFGEDSDCMYQMGSWN